MLVVPSLLALAFGWAAVAKVTRFPAWRAALAGYRLPPAVATPALFVVPAAEVGTAFLLARGGDVTRAGAALSVALLAAFSLAVLRARRLQGDRLPCGCFGGSGTRDYRLMLVRNGFLGAVAAAILLVPRAATYALESPDSSQTIPVLLVAAGLVLIGWLVLAARGMGR
ncbi:MAG TPA: MauE/DoxX family redox-associated membrane protein [Actinomycetota bacterium]|nr:MauE/DoxX family redox-associated membrane protein [Actinomycetota bacterium]